MIYARAALWSLTIIIFTGAAVRLTGSGLGCSDWPQCEQDQFVASLEYHALIEFGNRLFTGVVAIAVMLAVLGSLRRVPKRNDLIWWSLGLVAGVIGQIVLGALLVQTELDPRFTMGHFLLSMVLLWNAVVLIERARDDDLGPRQSSPMATAAAAVFAVGSILLLTGTIVTGSGPHAGSDDPETAARLPFLIHEVTRIHSVTAFTVLGGVWFTIRYSTKLGRYDVRQQAMRVFSMLIAQTALGYWQYFTGVPELLVFLHIMFASFTWIQIVKLAWMAQRSPVAATTSGAVPKQHDRTAHNS